MPIQPVRRARSRGCRSSDILTAIILLAMGWYPAGAGAGTVDSGTSMFSFNGFGSLGIVHSSDNQADFLASAYQPTGPGFSRSWSATPDSQLGLQLTANL